MNLPAVFLDRDGTIIVERNYLCDPAGVELERNTPEGLRAIAAMGYCLVVLSNQSGIARGMYGEKEAVAVNQRAAELLAREGIVITEWHFCPHDLDDDCSCRKPRPGMALAAASALNLDLAASFVIGDKRADLETAAAIGAHGILVLTGHGQEHEQWAVSNRYPVCRDILDAAGQIMALRSQKRCSGRNV